MEALKSLQILRSRTAGNMSAAQLSQPSRLPIISTSAQRRMKNHSFQVKLTKVKFKVKSATILAQACQLSINKCLSRFHCQRVSKEPKQLFKPSLTSKTQQSSSVHTKSSSNMIKGFSSRLIKMISPSTLE